MIGKCDECGMENVEIKAINKDVEPKFTVKSRNQCRPPDGAYVY